MRATSAAECRSRVGLRQRGELLGCSISILIKLVHPHKVPLVSPASPERDDGPATAGGFHTTHWTVVLAAGDSTSPRAAEALEQLCRTYWYPLYAYIRRSDFSPQDAEDLTQAFFVRLLEHGRLQLAQRDRGKFRTFLLTALKNFLANEWHRARAEKRGGGAPHLAFDSAEGEVLYQLEPAHDLTAEKLYEQSWATALLERVRLRVRQEYAAEGKADRFAAAEQFLPGEDGRKTYGEVAQTLGVPEGTLKSDVHRLKQRYGDLLRAEIMQTVERPEEIAEELRHLMRVLSG